jgi:hypothetical protein
VKRIPVLLAALLSLIAPARADVSISAYLEKIPGYQVRLQEETPGKGIGRARIGAFQTSLLDEYVLKSYSRWTIRPSGVESADRTVSLEVYESLDGPGAYGLFSIWGQVKNRRLTGRLDVPIEHRYSATDLIFSRRNYFLHLGLNGSDRESAARLLRALLDAIPAMSDLPVAVARLPEQDLKLASVEYYLGPNGLNLAREFPARLMPLIGFKDHIEIASARYDPNDTPLFLIAYPTPGLAQVYEGKLAEGFPNAVQSGVYIKRSGPLIAVCVGPESSAKRLLERVNYKAKVKWIENKPEPNTTAAFLRIVVRALLGTALFLLITLALGLGAGYLRMQYLRRYPHLAKKTGMIRLDLEERDADDEADRLSS